MIDQLTPEAKETLTKMYNYMTKNLKLSKAAASSILGNVMQESTFNHLANSSSGAKGVYQLLGDKLKAYNSFLTTGWKDGPLTQTQFVYDQIMNGTDPYYDTLDVLETRKANNWKDENGYKNLNDSVYYTNVYLPRIKAKTLPPRRTDLVDAWKNSEDVDKLTELFMNYWEKPSASEANLKQRKAYAKEIYNYFQFGGTLNYLNYIQ